MNQSRWRYATLVSVLLVCAAVLTLTMRLRSSEHAVDAQQEALRAQRVALEANKDAVTELCRTNAILRGLVAEAVDLSEDRLAAGRVPEAEQQRLRLNVAIYQGYIEQLDQQTACREVVHP